MLAMSGPKFFYFLTKLGRTFCYAFLQDTEILCKINGLEIFLGHSSQKHFLNLLVQKKKITEKQTTTEKNQTKTRQTRKAPEVFHASILKKIFHLAIYRQQRQQFHLQTGV